MNKKVFQKQEWSEAGCLVPKQVKSELLAKEVMAQVFGIQESFMYWMYWKDCDCDYNCNLLGSLKEKCLEKRSGLAKKEIIYHQHNESAQRSLLIDDC